MKSGKETLLMIACAAALLKFIAMHNNSPLIYAFMKESPMGFWVGCKKKTALSEEARVEKSDRQIQGKKGRTHH